MKSNILVILSSLLVLASCPAYVVSIIKKETQPQRTTWFIFTFLCLIALISQALLGGGESIYFLAFDTFDCALIFALSLKYGIGGYSKTELFAVLVAAVFVTISIAVNNPLVSLFGAIAADIIAATFTLQKVYKNPESEAYLGWLLVGTAAMLSVLTIQQPRFEIILFPLYVSFINFLIPSFKFFRSKKWFSLNPVTAN